MNTRFLLMAQYGGKAVIPLDIVRKDYFPHLTTEKLAHKMSRGEIKLPMLRIEASQKAARGVHIDNLATWIDERKEAAEKELRQLTE